MLDEKDKQRIIQLHQNCSIYSPISEEKLFQKIIIALAQPFQKLNITKVVGIESRGFLLASAVAFVLKAGVVVIRKKGTMYPPDILKLYPIKQCSFVDYGGKEKTLEIENNKFIIKRNDRLLIVDDWLSTGSHARASINLVNSLKRGKIIGFSFVLDSMTSKTKYEFKESILHSLVSYLPPDVELETKPRLTN